MKHLIISETEWRKLTIAQAISLHLLITCDTIYKPEPIRLWLWAKEIRN